MRNTSASTVGLITNSPRPSENMSISTEMKVATVGEFGLITAGFHIKAETPVTGGSANVAEKVGSSRSPPCTPAFPLNIYPKSRRIKRTCAEKTLE